MAEQQKEPRPLAIEPPATGIGDGVTAGYRAVHHVMAGFKASLGIRDPQRAQMATEGRPPVQPLTQQRRQQAPRDASGAAPAGSADLATDIAQIIAELLKQAGDIAHDVADGISDRSGDDDGSGGERVVFEAFNGGTTQGTFTFWNTSAVALRKVRLHACDLDGPATRISFERIRFGPAEIPFVRSGDSVTVRVEIDVPEDAPSGTYRALAQADPGGAFVVLEVKVDGADDDEAAREAEAPRIE